MGAAIGVDAQTYGKFEAEKRWPKGERLAKLAKFFGQPLPQMKARMALAKAVAECDADLDSVATAVEEAQAAYGGVNTLSVTLNNKK